MSYADMRRRLTQLREEADRLEAAIGKCPHPRYGPAEYDPEIKKEEYEVGPVHYEGIHMIREKRTRDVKVDRWSKSCLECGHKKYTNKITVSSVTPDFGEGS
jgi:hypothetical protein